MSFVRGTYRTIDMVGVTSVQLIGEFLRFGFVELIAEPNFIAESNFK